jgi:hypothetical protein
LLQKFGGFMQGVAGRLESPSADFRNNMVHGLGLDKTTEAANKPETQAAKKDEKKLKI